MTPEDRLIKPSVSPSRREIACALVLLVAGVVPRVLLALNFPTIPVSDFKTIVESASRIAAGIATKGSWEWTILGPALPLLLSPLFIMLRASPESVARAATFLATGLMPLLPFYIWRGALSIRARMLAGVLLALWPGQVLFSGVVALDNWTTIPTVALASLSVRAGVQRRPAHALAVAALYTIGWALRPEMAIVLVPLALAGLHSPTPGFARRNLAIAIASSILIATAIMALAAATIGTYRISPSHSGGAVLGAYVPGAGLDYWTDPKPFVAAVEPALLEQDQASISRGEMRLALGEFMRRPPFHAIRILAGSLSAILRNDSGLLYWSMTGPGTLPGDSQLTALRLLDRVRPILLLVAPIGLALFLFSSGIVGARRSGVGRVVAPLLAAIGLKIAIHGLAVAQPRYYLPAIALAILVIAICVDALFLRDLRKAAIWSAGAALLCVVALHWSLAAAERYVQSHDLVPQMTYRFPLRTGAARLSCLMSSGRLLSLYQQQFTVQLSAGETLPPQTATVQCSSFPTHNPLTLVVESTAGTTQHSGGSPMVEVDVNGARVLEADAHPAAIAEWLVARAGPYPEDTPISVDMRVVFSQAASGLTPSPTVTFRIRSR